MKQLSAIFWKEWHDARWFLTVALLLFVEMPAIGAAQARFSYSTQFDFIASPWVIPFGGIVAILTAIGITYRDLGSRIQDFWRSHAISILPWILVKYLVGLAVVLIACVLPLLLECCSRIRSISLASSIGSQISIPIIYLFTPLWTTLYSIAFLCACMVRRPAHATMLALAAMLLIYFLPIVVPSLNWLSIANFIDLENFSDNRSEQLWWIAGFYPIRLRYAGGMLAIAFVAMVISVIAVKRDWRIQSGTKLMYWAVGCALLLLFSTVAVQLGTNLPVLDQLDLPAGEKVRSIQIDGSHGMILTMSDKRLEWSRPGVSPAVVFPPRLQFIDLKDNHLVLSPQINLSAESLRDVSQPCVLHGHILYAVFDDNQLPNFGFTTELRVTDLDNPSVVKPFATFPRGSQVYAMFIRDQLLYVIRGEELALFDISVPAQPRLLSDQKLPWGNVSDQGTYDRGTYSAFQYRIPLIPGFSDRERLQLVMGHTGRVLAGDIVVTAEQYVPSQRDLIFYKLDRVEDGGAYFTRIGRYQSSSLLHRIFGNKEFPLGGSQQAFYMDEKNDVPGKEMAGFTIFNLEDPSHPRRIAHFAAPSHYMVVQPLPDGRTIVGGDKLYLLGKPRS